jgi:hypothetical protein
MFAAILFCFFSSLPPAQRRTSTCRKGLCAGAPPRQRRSGGRSRAMASPVLFRKDGTEYRVGDIVECRAEEGPSYIGVPDHSPPPPRGCRRTAGSGVPPDPGPPALFIAGPRSPPPSPPASLPLVARWMTARRSRDSCGTRRRDPDRDLRA